MCGYMNAQEKQKTFKTSSKNVERNQLDTWLTEHAISLLRLTTAYEGVNGTSTHEQEPTEYIQWKQHRIRLIEPVSAKPVSLEAQSHTKYECAFTLNKKMFLSFFLQRISIQASQENMFWIWKGSQRAQIWFSKMVSDLATFSANVSKAPLMMGLPVKNSDRSWQQLVMNMCFQIVEFNIMIHRKSNG